MTPRTHRGADALVAAMRGAGVARLFTLSGNHVMPVFDATVGTGIELLHVRHEAAAVHMADAWARLTGEPGIAMVTGGPGHANAVSALYTASMAESPVVLLSGHAPVSQLGLGAFQEMRQADLAAPLCKASWTCADAASLAGDFRKAVAIARSGRPGPVHLSLPSDALESKVETTDPAGIKSLGSDPRDLITAAFREGRRPLVLAGPTCGTKRGRERLAALEAATGMPTVVMESPRGVADPSLGDFAAILAKADRVVLLGKRLDFTLRFGKPLAADARIAQADAEAGEFERTRRAMGERLDATLEADAFAAIGAMIAAADGRGKSDAGWLREVREAVAFRPASWDTATSIEGRVHPARALRPLQALLDAHPDSVFVCDGGEIGQWAQACLHAPNRVINGIAGSIGAALPFALAARVARPGVPVVAVMGDGTFGFHPAEIDTAVRHGLAFVLVVGNDARWNAEYQIQLREYGRERAIGCELAPTRYDEVARAFGGHGELVTRAEEMLPAARRAQASGKPAVLNVMIEGLAAPDIRRG